MSFSRRSHSSSSTISKRIPILFIAGTNSAQAAFLAYSPRRRARGDTPACSPTVPGAAQIHSIAPTRGRRAAHHTPDGWRSTGRHSSRRHPAGQRAAGLTEVVDRIEGLPGVEAVGIGSFLPVADREPTRPLVVDGYRPRTPEQLWAAEARVNAGYRRALGVSLIAGTDLDPRDVRDARPVAMVNQTMAQRYWGDASPVGRRVRLGTESDATPWLTIIGVVGDVRNSDVDQPSLPQVYVPYTVAPGNAMAVFVRTEDDPLALSPDVRQAVWSVDPTLPVYAVRSMEQVLANDLGESVFFGTLLLALAIVAVGLAASGVYAVLSAVVGQRMPELGMRRALGAGRSQIVGLVVRDGLHYGVIGIGFGVLGALAAAHLVADGLYGVAPSDLLTYVGSVVVLLLTIAAAAWLPARAAAHLSPLVAIRRD